MGSGAAGVGAGDYVTLGFAFLDAAAGHYYVGSISDGAARANLTTLLTQVQMCCLCMSNLVEHLQTPDGIQTLRAECKAAEQGLRDSSLLCGALLIC